jgi:hypothetical protein
MAGMPGGSVTAVLVVPGRSARPAVMAAGVVCCGATAVTAVPVVRWLMVGVAVMPVVCRFTAMVGRAVGVVCPVMAVMVGAAAL